MQFGVEVGGDEGEGEAAQGVGHAAETAHDGGRGGFCAGVGVDVWLDVWLID